MTIKLQAKLAAYSRVSNSSLLPPVSPNDSGKLVGVNNGKYELIGDLDNRKIDDLFDSTIDYPASNDNSKNFIDSLFEEDN